ncbi:MAG TPA: carbohydrate kinase family protein [Planctomycetes bacterium]|nr:carbohydrate kinase family protein [Planctomycetota bacterium]
MTPKGMLFGGSMIVDLVKRISRFPGRGKLAVIHDVTRGVGGMACNNPVNVKVLNPDADVATMGRIGDDELGRYIIAQLSKKGVDTDAVAPTPAVPTSFTDVMVDVEDGSRTFFHSYGACALWRPEDIPWDALAGRFSCVHLGYVLLLESMDADDGEHGTVLAGVLKRFRDMGLRTAIDVVSEEGDRFRKIVTPSLRHVDDLVINEVEASAVTGTAVRDGDGTLSVAGLSTAAERLFEAGVNKTVVLHAPEGALALTAEGKKYLQPSHDIKKTEIVSSVGAGDAFASGVLYGLNRGEDVPHALKLGTAMAALNLFDPTTTGGAKPYADVIAFANSRPYRKGTFDEH